MFQNIGPVELIIILAVALMVFGPAKLPELGRALGRGVREFRRAAREVTDELERAGAAEDPRPAREGERRQEEGRGERGPGPGEAGF